MRFLLVSCLAISVVFSLFSGAASTTLVGRAASDLCGEVQADLKVPHPTSGNYISVGSIEECICVSELPHYVATNHIAVAAVKLYGKSEVTAQLTEMIKKCKHPKQCHYPLHAVPACLKGNPCGFTCKDGYTPFPLARPTECVCEKPHKECNGKCGLHHSCPSAHVKREAHFGGERECPKGLTACGILGRNARTWECLNTQNELESCGGCSIPLDTSSPEGQDCTSMVGVSDVSCVMGRCVVHRCMPGYDVHANGSSCIYSEDKDPVILASQYGLEHVPF